MNKKIELDKDELLLQFETTIIWLTQEQERGAPKDRINKLSKQATLLEKEIYNRMR